MTAHDQQRSVVNRLLESNERRLDNLDSHGIRVFLDGPAVLRFLLDQTLAAPCAWQFQRQWASNVAGLLTQCDDHAGPSTDIAIVGHRHTHTPLRMESSR
jgi:hypothetical protein